MNQNYRSSKLKNIHSEFTDNKRVDGQILPTNFALIHMVFLLLTHKEHGKLAKYATKLNVGLNKWPKRGERMTQNFGELIFYTSQSQ
jgi:hypothetical protein